jgi:hypothetical protein
LRKIHGKLRPQVIALSLNRFIIAPLGTWLACSTT